MARPPPELRMPPGAEDMVRRAIAAQRAAALSFDLREADAAEEQRVRARRWLALRAQRRRRDAWARHDAYYLQQTHTMLEAVVRAVRDRHTTLHADGYQAFVFPNGDVYEGHWKNSCMHGKGVLRRDTAKDVYEGQWFLGQRCGAGMYHCSHHPEDDSGGGGGDTNNSNKDKDRSKRNNSSSSSGSSGIGDARARQQPQQGESHEEGGQHGFLYYNGAWLDDKMHGKGELLEPEGLYVGEFVANRPHGYGEYVYKDGHVYRGEWVDGLYEGNGVYLYPSGARYEGRWLRGRQHGRGMMTYFNGDTYVGEWRHDAAHGHGVYTSASTAVHVEGEWAYGSLHGGEAAATWHGGSGNNNNNMAATGGSATAAAAGVGTAATVTYTGGWSRDCFDGAYSTLVVVEDARSGGGGVVAGGVGGNNMLVVSRPGSHAAHVRRYVGGFAHGKRHGHGEYRDALLRYSGEWCNDEKHGYGVITIDDSGTFAGNWYHGEPDGEGTVTSADGSGQLQVTLRRGVCDRVVDMTAFARAEARLGRQQRRHSGSSGGGGGAHDTDSAKRM